MERFNIIFGGAAGQGPNILGELLGKTLVKYGYYVFYSRDYQSLIRGGHNFNVLTFCDQPVYSNDSVVDVLVAIDELTETLHKKELNKKGIILKGQKENMYYAGALFKLLGIPFKILQEELWELGHRYEENLAISKKGYDEEKRNLIQIEKKKNKGEFWTGSTGITRGAVNAGLDVYYAYPMTPATPVLRELAQDQVKKNYVVIELENEISVIHAAIGSAITGAKSMVGSSGGGFDLMTEALSMAGMAEVPLVLYLAQRPGPASGVPTYNAQGDLNMARHAGHGEFPRMLIAPGDPKECEELSTQAFYFSQKFKLPVIVISDKHLAESYYTTIGKSNLTKSIKLTTLKKFNSYEWNSEGTSTEDPKEIIEATKRRLKRILDVSKEAKKFDMIKKYGKSGSKNLIISWGSTKGAVLDAIKGINVEFVQILYMDPFPEDVIKQMMKKKNVILVENNSTAQLGQLIAEKTGEIIPDKQKILRYDGRPFLADELKIEIKKRLK